MLADIAQAAETLSNIAQAAISVASTDAPGRVELATTEETAAGTDTTRAVTPAGLAAQHYIKSKDVTYKALNDNGCVGSDASQVARGDHGHPNASSAAAGFISAADKFKLDGIEAEATADQTGAEIVAAIDTELGGTHWQQGGEGIDEPHTHSAADLPDRGAFYGNAMGASLAENGGMVDINVPGLPAKAAAGAADLVPIWDAEAAAHRHVPVAGLPADRGIVAPSGEDPAISMELPAAVDRRDFLLGFTATGAVTTTKVATARDVDDLAARGMTTVENIAELSAARPRRAGGVVYVRGYHRAGDGGGGTFTWDAASTKTPDGGTVFAADGGETGRWIKLYDQFVNIKSFGAKGDNSTDDTAAVQRAVDANVPLFVPKGTYLLSAPITWDPMSRSLIMTGQGWSRFVDNRSGNPEEPLFHRIRRYMKADGTYLNDIEGHPWNTLGNRVVLKDLSFLANKGKYGHAFEISGCRDSFIENCYFQSTFRGLTLDKTNFDTAVINCRFEGRFVKHYPWEGETNGESNKEIAKRAWGLYVGGHKWIKGIHIRNYGVGLVAIGVGNVLSGARIEENNYGLILGNIACEVDGTGIGMLSSSSLTGARLEANTIGVLVKNVRSTLISGIDAQGSPGLPEYGRPDSEVGALIESIYCSAKLENCSFNGYFRRGAIINITKNALWHDTGGVTGGGGVDRGAVNAPLNVTGTNSVSHHFLGTQMFPNATRERHRTLTSFHDLMMPGLTGLNIRDIAASGIAKGGPVFARNFGNVVLPENAATSVAVNFPTEIVTNNYAFNQIFTQSDTASTLTAGTYFYATTVIAPHGETGIDYNNPTLHAYRTIEVNAGQRVNMTFLKNSPSWLRRRIYRGRKHGWFEGYWDIPMGAPFADNGNTPFYGKGMPSSHGNIPSCAEDDVNYQILAMPSWATTVHLSDKTITGFTLNFGTPVPDGNQTVAWLLFRP